MNFIYKIYLLFFFKILFCSDKVLKDWKHLNLTNNHFEKNYLILSQFLCQSKIYYKEFCAKRINVEDN